MLEIYVLKLCVGSVEGALPCRVENALISKKPRALLSEAAPMGAEPPSPEGPGNRPIGARRVADQTWPSAPLRVPLPHLFLSKSERKQTPPPPLDGKRRRTGEQ